MLKPARMSKLKVLVLDQYYEDVVREFSRLGNVHLLDVKNSSEEIKNLETSSESQVAIKSSEILGRIYYLIDILGISEERDFFGSLKNEPKRMHWKDERSDKQLSKVEDMLSEIEKNVVKNADSLVRMKEEEAALEPKRHVLESISRLNVKSGWLGESRFLYLVAGEMTPEELDRLETMLEKEGIVYALKESNNSEKISVLIATPRTNKQDLDRILSGYSFNKFAIDQTLSQDSLKEIQKRQGEIARDKKHVEKELADAKKKYGEKLLALREIVQIEKDLAETTSFTGKTKRVYVLEGWVPTKKVESLKSMIEEVSHGHALVKSMKPKKGETIPTKLDNPGIFKPFEVLVETFGLPAYKELDPTPIFALTFPLFYGLMFGDVGHGLILVLLGLLVVKLAKSINGVKSLGVIIMVCGLFSMVFGFVYGEAFGMSQETQHEIMGFAFPMLFPVTEELHGALKTVPLTNPVEFPIKFLQMAVLVGAVHIGSGIVMNLLNKIKEKQYLAAIAVPLPKLWLYYGFVYLFYTYWIDFNAWGQNLPLVIALIPVPLVLIMLSEVIRHLPHIDMKHLPALLGEGAFEAFDTLLNFLSNSISYSRIFALALVHAGLFIALYKVAHLFMEMPVVGGLIWFLVVLAGTAGILALESIIVFLHSLRLHYYEWFTKFYGADGVKYVPFKAQRVYTKLEE
jgi:V/A-type H+-transporting ATPase subunit I